MPERRLQIVQMTIRVAMCLDAEARAFLADCMAALIEGGLEYMKKRRREMFEALQAHSQEEDAIILIDSSEDQLLEEVGGALDALRMAEIARQVWPAEQGRLPAWQVARAILADEAAVKRIMVEAVKVRGDGDASKRSLDDLLGLVRAAMPAWIQAAPSLADLCKQAAGGAADLGAQIFGAVATADHRAKVVLDFMAGGQADALEYLGEVRKRIDALKELEAQENK